MKRLQVQIEDELMKELKQYALDKDISIKESVTILIDLSLRLNAKDLETKKKVYEILRISELPRLGEE
jgi:hypothetical protein